MVDENKITAFGKSYEKVGDEKRNLCLATAGDIKIKTANSFFTVFRDGKLNVEDTKVLYEVSSMDEADADGVYFVTETSEETDEDSSESQSVETKHDVYLYIDGLKILLASTTDAYISYGIVQNLTAEQFLLALKNIGFYFQTLDDARNSGITDGLVYIIEESKMYKVTGGVFVDYYQSSYELYLEEHIEETTEEVKDALTIGSIFLDGENEIINVNNKLAIEVNGVDYFLLKSNVIKAQKEVDFEGDVVLANNKTLKSDGAIKDLSGFMVYGSRSDMTLEVDNLVVRNGWEEYTPILTSAQISSEVQNVILSATYEDSGIEIDLKYRNEFIKDDIVAIFSSYGKPLTIECEESEDTGDTILVATGENLTEETKIQVNYIYSVCIDDDDEDGDENRCEEMLGSCNITLELEDEEDEDGTTYWSGKNEQTLAFVDKDDFERIVSIKVLSGDNSVIYNEGNLPNIYYGTVVNEVPLRIKAGDLTMEDIGGLKNTIISRIKPAGSNEWIIYEEGANIKVRQYDDESGNYKDFVAIGDIESFIDSDSEEVDKIGVYSKLFIGVNAYVSKIQCEELIVDELDRLRYKDNASEIIGDDDGRVIPDINMVQKMIEEAIEKLGENP